MVFFSRSEWFSTFLVLSFALSVSLSPLVDASNLKNKFFSPRSLRSKSHSATFPNSSSAASASVSSYSTLTLEALPSCLNNARFHVIEHPVTELQDNKEMKKLYKHDTQGDYLDFESCLRTVKSVYSKDLSPDTTTLPIQVKIRTRL